MKNRSTVAVAGLVAALVVAVGVGIGAQPPKALAGTWKLNAAKSKFSPGPAPKNMTIVYTPEGEGLKVVVDVVPADGAAQKWEMSGKYDGKDHPMKGHPLADTAAFKSIDANTVESTFKKDGKVVSTNRRVLSADGKTLTVTSKGTTADGKPRTDVQVFEK
jgi:hypothetical protein